MEMKMVCLVMGMNLWLFFTKFIKSREIADLSSFSLTLIGVAILLFAK